MADLEPPPLPSPSLPLSYWIAGAAIAVGALASVALQPEGRARLTAIDKRGCLAREAAQPLEGQELRPPGGNQP